MTSHAQNLQHKITEQEQYVISSFIKSDLIPF